MPPEGSAWHLLRQVVEGEGATRPYLVTAGGMWTYGQVWEAVTCAAAFFQRQGLTPGDRVVLVMGDRPELVVSFWACLALGLVAVPLAPAFSPLELRQVLQDAKPALALADTAGARPLLVAAEGIRLPVLVVGERPYWADVSESVAPLPLPGDTPALLLYTSGTTGQMKGAMHSHANVLAAAGGLGPQVLHLSPEDRVFSASRMFFAYGLGNSVYIPAACGCAAVVHPGPLLPATVREIMQQYRPTVFMAVPSLYRALLQDPAVPWRVLRAAVSAGEKLPPELWRSLSRRARIPVLDGLGMTETLHHITSNRVGEVAPGSVGRPLDGFQLQVVGEGGEVLGEGEVGELWVRGPSVMQGYWRQEEKTARVLQGGWLRTGDLVALRGGFCFYYGRRDELLKLGGIAVFPSEVETVLKKHPAVAEAAVVPVERGAGVVTLKALIVLRPGATLKESEIYRFCRQRLAAFKVPREFQWVENLPLTASGKLRRFQLVAGARAP
ncbi:MAG: AMP-binding protein [Thermoanaerobaculum sp.]|nr:AMP-binding protein [Thermoanaerobaculum sp.]